MPCPNCGYGFQPESQGPQRVFHACPRCGHRFNPPLVVGRAEESENQQAPYQSLVERQND